MGRSERRAECCGIATRPRARRNVPTDGGFQVRCSRQEPRLDSRADRGRSPAFAVITSLCRSVCNCLTSPASVLVAGADNLGPTTLTAGSDSCSQTGTRKHLRNTCETLAGHCRRMDSTKTRSGDSIRTLCKRFTRVSSDIIGPRCQTDWAPMPVGTPLPVIMPVFRALGPTLWSREGLSAKPRAFVRHRLNPVTTGGVLKMQVTA